MPVGLAVDGFAVVVGALVLLGALVTGTFVGFAVLLGFEVTGAFEGLLDLPPAPPAPDPDPYA
jgi:hypothetical protein